MGKIQKYVLEAIAVIEPKLCFNHWKVLYKLCVFYVDRISKNKGLYLEQYDTIKVYIGSSMIQ
jgi:hypothetical protein